MGCNLDLTSFSGVFYLLLIQDADGAKETIKWVAER